jgi:hypothetical protein
LRKTLLFHSFFEIPKDQKAYTEMDCVGQVRLETCALAKSIRRLWLNQIAGEVSILHAEWKTFRGAKP